MLKFWLSVGSPSVVSSMLRSFVRGRIFRHWFYLREARSHIGCSLALPPFPLLVSDLLFLTCSNVELTLD